MTDAALSSPISGHRDLERLSLQRQKAQQRLLHERTRNARLAVAGIVGLTVLLGIGIHSGWMPAVSPGRPPLDARSREFIATRIGHIVLPAEQDATCRELDFHNDDGTFSEGRTVDCVDALAPTVDPVIVDANGRASSIRSFFSKR